MKSLMMLALLATTSPVFAAPGTATPTQRDNRPATHQDKSQDDAKACFGRFRGDDVKGHDGANRDHDWLGKGDYPPYTDQWQEEHCDAD